MKSSDDNSSAPQRVEPRRKRRRSSGELNARAQKVQARIEETLAQRSAAWADPETIGRDPFLVHRQDGDQTPNRGALAYEHPEVPGSLKGLHVEKRVAMHGSHLGSKEL